MGGLTNCHPGAGRAPAPIKTRRNAARVIGRFWVPACAGMTAIGEVANFRKNPLSLRGAQPPELSFQLVLILLAVGAVFGAAIERRQFAARSNRSSNQAVLLALAQPLPAVPAE